MSLLASVRGCFCTLLFLLISTKYNFVAKCWWGYGNKVGGGVRGTEGDDGLQTHSVPGSSVSINKDFFSFIGGIIDWIHNRAERCWVFLNLTHFWGWALGTSKLACCACAAHPMIRAQVSHVKLKSRVFQVTLVGLKFKYKMVSPFFSITGQSLRTAVNQPCPFINQLFLWVTCSGSNWLAHSFSKTLYLSSLKDEIFASLLLPADDQTWGSNRKCKIHFLFS